MQALSPLSVVCNAYHYLSVAVAIAQSFIFRVLLLCGFSAQNKKCGIQQDIGLPKAFKLSPIHSQVLFV